MKMISENYRGQGAFLKRNSYQRSLVACMLLAVAVTGGSAQAARVSDIKNTKHNFSHQGGNVVRAAEQIPSKQQNQICVFCHTPHGTTPGAAPLWNKKLSTATYSVYTSLTLDSEIIKGSTNDQPAGSAKLCLSCHDGTLAIGDVNVMWGLGTSQSSWYQQMVGTDQYGTDFFEGKMPFGGNPIGTAGGKAASGVVPNNTATAAQSGFTRRLGTDLTNDHPISVSFTNALATRDGEMRHLDPVTQKSLAGDPLAPGYTAGQIVGVRGAKAYRPLVPLEPVGLSPVGEGQVECASCHDPHFRDTDPTIGNIKFLRLNRFQMAAPTANYNNVTDIMCLACHTRGGASWAYSAHANPLITDPTKSTAVVFTTPAAQERQFPTTVDNGAATNLPVWKAACLNCHDPHTVQGSRKLLREGTDSTAVPKVGGNPSIEEACFQCHTPSTDPKIAITRTASAAVPDIATDFNLARHMPIKSTDQAYFKSTGVVKEVHDIGGNFNDIATFSDLSAGHEGVDCSYPAGSNKCGADFVESRAKLGVGVTATVNPNPALVNRHVECTDCHNPHRMVKFETAFPTNLAGTPDTAATHKHTDVAGYTHNNVASGALRGTYGVEPVYNASTSFMLMPTGFDVKRGDPGNAQLGVADCHGTNKPTCDAMPFVTREYQICLKCHSNYGFSDNTMTTGTNIQDATGNRPLLGSFSGGTPSGTNGLTMYTNVGREIQAPVSHQGEGVQGLVTGANPAYSTATFNYNHRAWHPVMNVTGRTLAVRGIPAGSVNWNLPFRNAVGTQTMYCTDCHGSNTATGTVIPAAGASGTGGAPWGPHGSSNNFILKGTWDNPVAGNGTGTGHQGDGLCFKCHEYNTYAMANGGSNNSGWCCAMSTNLHHFHANLIGHMRCQWCHIAIPHGWKNKNFLVNLNDVGPEGGHPVGTQVYDDGKGGNINNNAVGYTNPPYYNNAVLKIINIAKSGDWQENDCGSVGGATGRNWMLSADGCVNMP